MKKGIIIFGAGVEGCQALQLIGRDRVQYFVDNNMELWGKRIENIEIISCDRLKVLPKNYCIVIATHKYYEEIKEQLNSIHITNFFNVYQFLIKEKFELSQSKTSRIILMNTHDKTNVGDHLISVAERLFFEQYLPNYEVIEIPANYINNNLLDLKVFIRPTDVLAITGGGFLGSMWLDSGENNVRKIVREFTDNKVIIMPQTMYFEDTKDGGEQEKITKKIYEEHPNLTICFREKTSYNLGRKLLKESVRKLYCPDMVTILNWGSNLNTDGNRIGICLRKDKESILSSEDKEWIIKNITSRGNECVEFTMHTEENVIEEHRMQAINSKLEVINSTRLVITDRLHCMLLCAISGIPCIAFNNLSGKVAGVYEWIKNNSYIRYVDKIEDGMEIIDKLWEETECVYENERLKGCFTKLAEEFQK